MYEDKTPENVQKDLLSNISDSYDKTVGYPTYDINKSFAIEESKIYSAIDSAINMLDVDNLIGDDLERYVQQRKGVIRKPGTYASTELTVNGTATIKAGDLFETPGGIQFACTIDTDIVGSGLIPVQAVLLGSGSNTPVNTITQIPVTIAGVISVTNIEAVTNGYDPENDDSLRERYYNILQHPITSNNKYAFEEWAKEVTGIGDAKCFPTWQGANTVKVVVINSNKQIASQDLINAVQEYIDPKGVQDEEGNWSTWGTGAGTASMGSYCTVDTATAKTVNINVTITKDSNYMDDQVKQNISDYISGYFSSIALDEYNSYVSYAKVGNLILNANGVQDYRDLSINNGNANIPLSLTKDLCEVPMLGEVNIADA